MRREAEPPPSHASSDKKTQLMSVLLYQFDWLLPLASFRLRDTIGPIRHAQCGDTRLYRLATDGCRKSGQKRPAHKADATLATARPKPGVV